MKYSYGWLKEYVPKIPEPKRLAEILTTRAFEVEEIEKKGKDWVIDINVLPNRAFDCLSHIGMAREIAAIARTRNKEPGIRLKEDGELKIGDYLKVGVKEKKLCPRYSARMVVDVKVGESPQWLKDRLTACGLRPINNIVDITNYVMLETGQPLHAFDLEKVSGVEIRNPKSEIRNKSQIQNHKLQTKKIIVRKAKKGEKMVTLDGERKELDESVLVIADSKEPLAIAGIKGGKKAEIDKDTKTIILEAANFEPINIRKSSKALNLRTDSSIRFENGIDYHLTAEALDRAGALAQKLAGGRVAAGVVDVNLCKEKKTATAVTHGYIESLLGVEIASKEVLNILKSLDLPTKTTKRKAEIFYEIFVPSRRNDLNAPEDLIEEIGRIYGYEKIPAKMPTSVLIPAIKNEELMNEEKARDIMVGAGYAEVYNYSLVSEKDKELFGFHMAGPRYPLSNDQKYLRPTLIVRLLENVGENLKYFNRVRIFEIGKVFRLKGKNIFEKRMIAGVLCGNGVEEKNLFYEAKGTADLFLEKMGVPSFNYIEAAEPRGNCPPNFFGENLEGQAQNCAEIFNSVGQAKIVADNQEIGWIGEINKNILYSLGINAPVAAFELDFGAINELIEEEIAYRAPSKYPAIARDLTVLVDSRVKVEQVFNIIENNGGKLIVDVDLIDLYEGERLEAEKKSLTFHIIYQSNERSLTDNEVNKIQKKIIKALEGEGMGVKR